MRITNGRLVFEQYEKLTADGENGCTEIYMTIPGHNCSQCFFSDICGESDGMRNHCVDTHFILVRKGA